MVGTRKLARLLTAAQRAGAKVVLVGDHRQLPEIDAGGAYAALTRRLDPIVLTHNRRQTSPWERDALDQLRDGDPSDAVDAYRRHGRVVLADTADATREQLVADWWHARTTLGLDGIMVAARRADVADLNERARERLAAAGELTGPTLDAAGIDLQAGDEIVCLRNDRRLGVVNGTRATITSVDPAARTATALLDRDGRQVTLPADYLDAGLVDHAYALTGHKAQGATCGATFVLGSDAIYREWGYVALSRGRQLNRLYAVAGHEPDLETLATDHGATQPDPIRDPIDELVGRLDTSRIRQLATDQTHRPLTALTTDELADRHQQLRHRVLDALHTDRTRQADAIRERRGEVAARRQEAADRLSQARAAAEPRGLLRRRDPAAARQVDRWQAAIDLADRQLADLDRQLADLAPHATADDRDRAAADLAVVRDEIDRRTRDATRAAEFATPPYLAAAIGTRPDKPARPSRLAAGRPGGRALPHRPRHRRPRAAPRRPARRPDRPPCLRRRRPAARRRARPPPRRTQTCPTPTSTGAGSRTRPTSPANERNPECPT